MRRTLWVLAFALAECAPPNAYRATVRPWPGRCELPDARTAEHITHADYQRLLPFRSYVRVARVGPYAQHVTVWFSCVEGNVARFEVSPSGEVTLQGHAWGGLAAPPKTIPEVPEEGRSAVDRVKAWFRGVAPDAGIAHVRYDGLYREVTLTAIEPFDAPGSQERQGAEATITFGTDENLSHVVRPDGGWSSELGTLCGAGDGCGEPPKWLPLASAPSTMAAMRAATADPGASSLVRAALDRVRGGGAVPLDALLANQEPVLIPREGLPRVVASVRLFGKGAPDSAVIRIPIDSGESAGGSASGEASVVWAGRHVRARARFSMDAQAPDGAFRAPVRLEVEVDDGREPSLVLRTRYDAVGVAQGGRFAVVAVTAREDTARAPRTLDDARTLFVSSPSLEVTVE